MIRYISIGTVVPLDFPGTRTLRRCLLVLLVLGVLFLPACSLRQMAMDEVAAALTGEGSSQVFTADNDPEFVADALPFVIKLYESLLLANPGHLGLAKSTGSLYVMYANAFLHTPAGMCSQEQFEEQEHLMMRAKNLYLRGRDFILSALEAKYPGFNRTLKAHSGNGECMHVAPADADLLYWAGAGWMGAFAIDPFDMELAVSLPQAAALMNKVMEVSPGFRGGAIHDFFILYYGSLPEYMGGDAAKARRHFRMALDAGKYPSASPYLSLATTVSVKEHNKQEFLDLINHALAVDPEADRPNRLMHIINRRKATWLKDHVDDFFLPDETTGM